MLIRGLEKIARAFPVAEPDTILRYANLPRDPLPLIRWKKHVQIEDHVLARWKRRFEAKEDRRAAPDLRVVEGIVAIATAFPLHVNTVYLYARQEHDPLPVIGLGTRHPWIWRDALEDWHERQAVPYQAIASALRKSGGRLDNT